MQIKQIQYKYVCFSKAFVMSSLMDNVCDILLLNFYTFYKFCISGIFIIKDRNFNCKIFFHCESMHFHNIIFIIVTYLTCPLKTPFLREKCGEEHLRICSISDVSHVCVHFELSFVPFPVCSMFIRYIFTFVCFSITQISIDITKFFVVSKMD